MSDLYLTLGSAGEGIVREKMSRFLAFAIPVDSPETAKAKIKEFQNKYHDSRHVCWAYMTGPNRDVWQLNDNGEPSGTAGKPILGQINSLNLTNVLVVVVRYFGGIKLGTSGLITAYRQAAREALDNAEIVERYDMRTAEISFPYLAMNDVMKLCKNLELKIENQQFDNFCTMTVSTRRDRLPELLSTANDIDGVKAEECDKA